MTFTINRLSLAKELSLLQVAMERKQLIPVLSTVMMGLVGDELSLTATDTDLTIITSLPANGESWGGCLPCRQLHDLVKLLDTENVDFTVKGNRMEVSAGTSKHLLPITPIAEFPEVKRPAENDAITLTLPQLNSMIAATSFAMLEPRNEIKASDTAFTGLSLTAAEGVLTVAASRKSVTAVAEMPCEAVFSVLLPRGAVSALQGLEGDLVAIAADGSQAEFKAGNRSVITRLLMGEFPKWRMFVPEYPYQATVNTEALSVALKRAQITMDKANPLGFESMKATVTGGQLTIETRGGDSGQSLEPVPITSNLNGEPFTVGFFAHQVLSVLGRCGENVTCELATPDSPIGITSEMAKYFIMPLRLKF